MKDLSRPENEMRCGRWKYCPEKRSLDFCVHNGQFLKPSYSVELDRLTNPGQFLDWVIQLHIKQHDVADFLNLVQLVCRELLGENIQGVFCPFESHNQIDWAKLTITPMQLEPRKQG